MDQNPSDAGLNRLQEALRAEVQASAARTQETLRAEIEASATRTQELLRAEIQASAAETRQGIQAAEARTREYVDQKVEDNRRHFGVIAEALESKIQIVAEGVTMVDEKFEGFRNEVREDFQRVDRRFVRLDARVEGVDARLAALDSRVTSALEGR